MELLIPGLILVALMVYASTRIKRTAAKAFEAETIETGDFVIKKPEGFLNVIGGDEQYAFEAYSKEFGGPGAEDIRQATAKVSVGNAETAKGDSEVISERNELLGSVKYHIVESKRIEKGVAFRILSKTAENRAKRYTFKITALAEASPDSMRKIEGMLDSFEVK